MSSRPDNSAARSASGGAIPEGSLPVASATYRWDLETRMLLLSPEMFRMFGVDSDTAVGDEKALVRAGVSPEDLDAIRRMADDALEGRTPRPLSFRIMLADGRVQVVWTESAVEFGEDGRPTALLGRVVQAGELLPHQIMSGARLRLLEFAEDHTLDELLEKTLDEAEVLSGSRIGFYHFVDDDQISLTLQNWSTRTKAEYCRAEGKGEHYPVSDAGVWVDCVYARAPVIHNDYASLPDRKGLPEGHAELVRELVVPVMRHGLVSAILGVGNKPTEYVAADVAAVSMLADLAWDIAESKIAQIALKKSERRFRLLFENMNEGVVFQMPDGTITSSNAAAQRMLGLTAGEIGARTSLDPRWRTVYEDGSPFPGSEHPTMVALRTGLPVSDVMMGFLGGAEEDTRWVLVSAVPLFEPGASSPYEVFVTFTDVTDLKNSREAAQRATELLAGLGEATSHLLAHFELTESDVAAALQAIAVVSGADCAYIYRSRDALGEAVLTSAREFEWHRQAGGVLCPPDATEQANAFSRWHDRFSTGEVVGFRVDQLLDSERAQFEARNVSSVLAVPVFSENEVWGYVAFELSAGARILSPAEVEMARTAASRLGTTIVLSSRALRDSLTGLYNRRYLDEALVQAVARAAREGSSLSVVLFDIDDFKAINDANGHAAGDAVLIALAKRLRAHSRAEDIAARLGGDEFVIVMPNATLEEAVESAERWRSLVERDSPSWEGGWSAGIKITAGVSTATPGQGAAWLLANADNAMLTAKNTGRNSVLAFR